jgi:HSP20 family molecular chaperone IbpA
MLETENEVLIIVALPGVEPEDLKVMINDGTLIVAGRRPMPGRSSRMMLRRLEIPHGHFERQLKLPQGRYEIGQRELRNGCLVLSLRKLR